MKVRLIYLAGICTNLEPKMKRSNLDVNFILCSLYQLFYYCGIKFLIHSLSSAFHRYLPSCSNVA